MGGIDGLTGVDIAAALVMPRPSRHGPIKLRPVCVDWVWYVYTGDTHAEARLRRAVVAEITNADEFVQQHKEGIARLAFEERMRNTTCRACNGAAEKCKACKGRGTHELSGRRRARLVGVHHHIYKRRELVIQREVHGLYGTMGNWQDEAEQHIERMTRRV